MAITYEPLCRVANCPAPSSDEWHRCLICGFAVVQHAHVLSRALRPDLKANPDNIVPLCVKHHTSVDQHREWHAVVYLPEKTYIRGNQGSHEVTFKKALERSSEAEQRPYKPQVTGSSPVAPTTFNGRVSDGEVRARQAEDSVLPGMRGEMDSVADDGSGTGTTVNHEDRARGGVQADPYSAFEARALRVIEAWQSSTGIKSALSWATGDLLLEAERELGESWAQIAELFPQSEKTLWNMVLVCQNIPLEERHNNLPFEHHKVVYTLNREDRDALLDKAEEGGWTLTQLREAVHGPKPKVKRYSIEKLWQLTLAYRWAYPEEDDIDAGMFLVWLEEQERSA